MAAFREPFDNGLAQPLHPSSTSVIPRWNKPPGCFFLMLAIAQNPFACPSSSDFEQRPSIHELLAQAARTCLFAVGLGRVPLPSEAV